MCHAIHQQQKSVQQRLFNDLAVAQAWYQRCQKNNATRTYDGIKVCAWKSQAQEQDIRKELIVEMNTANVTMT